MKTQINLDALTQPVEAPKEKKIITENPQDAQEILRLKLREKVKGIFHFYECPGGTLSFPFKRFKKDPVETYHFVDGEIREIPLGVALHLNESGKYPVYQYTKDHEGKVTMNTKQKVSRYGFESLEFRELDTKLT